MNEASEDKLLSKLEKTVVFSPNFNEEETAIIREMINWVRGAKAIGTFSQWARSIVIWVGAILGTWFALKFAVVDFIASVMKGNG
jgi:hypothetical protein